MPTMDSEFVQGVHLTRTEERDAEIEALVDHCGGRAGLGGLLADLDRRVRRTWAPGLKVSRAWTWEHEDRTTRRWWPQGISTSADADDQETVGGHRVVAVSWYSKTVDGENHGSRISFADLDRGRYRHVLLVQPELRDGRLGLSPLKVHAGGIVWCGPYLHVAGTRRGFFTARVDDLVRVPDDSDLPTYGHRYLLPVRFAYRATHDEGHEPLRYSFLSLDRSGPDGPALVAGEYGRGKQTTRLARFPLDPSTHHLRGGEDGVVRPLLLEDQGERGMQGAATVGGRWYVTSSHGPWGLGSMYVGRPGSFRRHRWALPMGPEDISYWPSADTFWSVTEHPWRRWVLTVRRRRLD